MQVNSIRGLVEAINCTELIDKIEKLDDLTGEAPNKIFHHSDLLYADGKRENLKLATYNDFDEVLKGLKLVLFEAAAQLDIDLPSKITAPYQDNWLDSFKSAWCKEGFDDSDIWNNQDF